MKGDRKNDRARRICPPWRRTRQEQIRRADEARRWPRGPRRAG